MKKMRYRACSVILALFLCFLLSACDDGKEPSAASGNSADGTNSAAQITLDFDIDTVAYKEKAKIYQASYLELNRDLITRTFIKGEITGESDIAEGRLIEAGTKEKKEFLTFYEGSRNGGFSYNSLKNNTPLDEYVGLVFAKEHPYHPLFAAGKFNTREEYPVKKDIHGIAYSDAYHRITDLFQTIGLLDVGLHETRTLDLETITHKYDLYTEYMKKDDMEIEPREYTREDECFYFSFRQTFDDLPVINVDWDDTHTLWGKYPASRLQLFFSAEGVKDFYATNLVRLNGDGEEKPLLSKGEVLSAIKKDLATLFFGGAVSVKSMELTYLIVANEGDLSLRPVWLFYTESDYVWDTIPCVKGDYMVYDAITGKRVQEL